MKKVVALAGGVGGAKLALGLYQLFLETRPEKTSISNRPNSPGVIETLTVIGNTGDDLELFGLRICPDLDTLLYTLANLANPETGWGIQGDTFNTLEMLKRLGADTWFRLGDQDFATHLLRTQQLKAGYSLTEVTLTLARSLGLSCSLLPMCNEDVRTIIQTAEAGELPFQEYFVRRLTRDTVTGLKFSGAEKATLSPEVREAIKEAGLIIFCPSNPYLSIWPILAVSGLKENLQAAAAPRVIVSPIVGGKALKGPAAAIMQTLGGEEVASALGVARLYQGLAGGFVLDTRDKEQEEEIKRLGFKTLVTDTVMLTPHDKTRLAAEIINFF